MGVRYRYGSMGMGMGDREMREGGWFVGRIGHINVFGQR